MSVHPFQQWITYVYKYTCTCYTYIIDKKVHPYRHPYKELDKVLHRQIFALHNEWLTGCIYSKSKITTYALRLTVFCCQNRLLTEPFRIKVGSSPLIFALYSSILYFSISCWRKQARVGKYLSSLHLYINCLAWSITKSKTVSVLMSISVPNSTRFCVNFTFNAVSHFSFNIVSSEVQKRLIQAHFQNICSMLSFSSL